MTTATHSRDIPVYASCAAAELASGHDARGKTLDWKFRHAAFGDPHWWLGFDGKILVAKVRHEAKGEVAEVTFTDTGIGMSAEEMAQITDPLYTTKLQGTGLGLAVCQQIIAKHDGSLDVSSEVGIGATFTVTIPLRPGDTGSADVQQLAIA